MSTAQPGVRAAADLARLADATRRLLVTCDRLGEDDLAAPSRLPGWSRAHLLTHLARNADSLRVLLLAARSGTPLSQYASPELRDADIAAGATRPAALVLLDVRVSAERFAVDAECLDPRTWAGQARTPRRSVPVAEVPSWRLREVEAHHADLGAGYELTDTPADVVVVFLDEARRRFVGSDLDPSTLVASDLARTWRIGTGDGPMVSGSATALLGWVLGRTGPQGLVSDRGPVPPSPGWG